MGLFPFFECKGRLDGVALGAGGKGDVRILAEWEWQTPPLDNRQWASDTLTFNEVDKLLESARDRKVAEFCFLLTYVPESGLEQAVERIHDRWRGGQGTCPLVLAVITFSGTGFREFSSLLIYEIVGNETTPRLLHDKPALPWKVGHTRWTIANE